MIKLFAFGVAANVVYVLTGLAKQYLYARALTVPDFGSFGAVTAMASLLLVLLPFPAYLTVLIRGFTEVGASASGRALLVRSANRELAVVGSLVGIAIATGAVAGTFGGTGFSSVSMALLLMAQYAAASTDILLRMHRAHQRLNSFMLIRNVPAIALFLLLDPKSPLELAAIELVGTIAIVIVIRRFGSPADPAAVDSAVGTLLSKEHTTLWLARLAQFGNSSLLRIAVPLAYGAHDTGLFFFACIAQLPCSLFLSVSTQLHGHDLAQLRPGDARRLWRLQLSFLAPNVLYSLAVVLLSPLLPVLLSNVPGIGKYSEAGGLIAAVTLYSAVLASDCSEYTLRSQGRSRILLLGNVCSALMQFAVLVLSWWMAASLTRAIIACAAANVVVVTTLSGYLFRMLNESRDISRLVRE